MAFYETWESVGEPQLVKGHTTRQGVFASGVKTIVEAVKYSKTVANSMDEYMKEVVE